MKRIRKIITIAILSLTGLCVVLLAISALANQTLPARSDSVEALSMFDKARLAETRHLLRELGGEVWPGWGEVDFPMIAYNEEYAFLVGYPNPPEGWFKVPAGNRRGIAWEPVPDDSFMGETYYRQHLSSVTPEAFTVMVGERWVCSLPTFDWMKIGLAQTIRADLPSFLQPVFPYRLFITQLVSGDDQYISLTAHECFHAYQGFLADEKLAAAENANAQYESQYPWENEALHANWQAELDLLADALRTTELETWRLASVNSYLPVPETGNLPTFGSYRGFEQRWTNELAQIRRMADDDGDGRFYYSGMAQAYLLDRLSPDWKNTAFDEGIWLDNLLQSVVQKHQ